MCVKKGETKKVQVTEGMKSLWGQEEKLYQQSSRIQSKLSKYTIF